MMLRALPLTLRLRWRRAARALRSTACVPSAGGYTARTVAQRASRSADSAELRAGPRSEEDAARLLAAGGLDALLALLDGACHAALLPLALSALAGKQKNLQ